jgi:hypothetical protein
MVPSTVTRALAFLDGIDCESAPTDGDRIHVDVS